MGHRHTLVVFLHARARMSIHHEYKTRLGGHVHTRASVRLMHGMATHGMSCFGPCLYNFRPQQHHLVSCLATAAFGICGSDESESAIVCSMPAENSFFIGDFPSFSRLFNTPPLLAGFRNGDNNLLSQSDQDLAPSKSLCRTPTR